MNLKKQAFSLIAILGFNIIAITLILILFEGILRFFELGTRDVFTVNEKEFHLVPGIYAPYQNFVSKEIPALPYHVKINNLGYRGNELNIKKQKGEFRILMAGDSFTYGDYVNNEETLPAQLETILKMECPKTRVINAGLRGGTITGESALINRGLALEPDLVLLIFYENDIKNMASPLWPQLQKNRFTKSQFPVSVIYSFMKYTFTWDYILKAKETLKVKNSIKQESELNISLKENKKIQLQEKYISELTNLYNVLEQNDTPFLFVVYPSYKTIMSGEYKLSSFLDKIMETNIHILNLTPPIDSAYEKEKAYLQPINAHASPYGYKISATYLSQYLLKSLVASQCNGYAP